MGLALVRFHGVLGSEFGLSGLGLMGLFFAGWFAGLVGEYVLHWAMHRFSMKFHISHHHEFFHLDEKDVALNTIDTRMNIQFFLALLAVLAPLMYVVGFAPVAMVWIGAFWHLTYVYEGVHALFHYDRVLPKGFRNSSFFRWWKGCHVEHHRGAPTGNYCVTLPALDFVLGSYVPPREQSDPVVEGSEVAS